MSMEYILDQVAGTYKGNVEVMYLMPIEKGTAESSN